MRTSSFNFNSTDENSSRMLSLYIKKGNSFRAPSASMKKPASGNISPKVSLRQSKENLNLPPPNINTFRQKSANKVSTMSNKNSISTLSIANKVGKVSSTIEKEKLYEDCINLKVSLNNLTQELYYYKSEVHKKDLELQRQSKVMQEIFTDTQNLEVFNSSGNFDNSKIVNKVKANGLIANLKRQYKDVKTELKSKIGEIEELKRMTKFSKIREVQIENKTLLEEMNRMKDDYEKLLSTSHYYDQLQKEYFILQENFSRQELFICSLQEEIRNLHNAANGGIANYSGTYVNDKNYIINPSKENIKNNVLLTNSSKHQNESVDEKMKMSTNNNNNNNDTNLYNISNTSHNSNQFTEEGLNEFSYILLKNFEAKLIPFDKINQVLTPNSPHSPEEIANKLITLLQVKNLSDKSKILFYIRSLLKAGNGNLNEVISLLLAQFINITIYTEKKEKKLKKKLKKFFRTSKVDLISSFRYYDSGNTKFINFVNLRKVLQNINTATHIKGKVIEFMIYYMKKIKEDDGRVGLEEMRYENVIQLLNDEKKDSDDESENKDKNVNGDNEDEDNHNHNHHNNNHNHSNNHNNNHSNNHHHNESNSKGEHLLREIEVNKSKQSVYIKTSFIDKTINESMPNNNHNNNNKSFHNKSEVIIIPNEDKSKNMDEYLDDEENAAVILTHHNTNEPNNNNNNNRPPTKENLNNDILKSLSKSNTLTNGKSNETPEEDDEEVTLTMKEFNQKVDQILSKLADILIASKKTVGEFFQNVITLHSVSSSETYEAIPLLEFITALRQLGLPIDTIDIYCIYTKLKYSDEYEMINVEKLVEEMLNYGIFEDKEINTNMTKENVNTNNNEQVEATKQALTPVLSKLLKEKGKTFDLFLFPVIGKIEVKKNSSGMMIKVLKKSEFVNFLKERGVTGVQVEDEYLENNGEDVNITTLARVLENANNVQDKGSNNLDSVNEYSVDFDNIENMDIEGLTD